MQAAARPWRRQQPSTGSERDSARWNAQKECSNRPQYQPTRGFYERCGYHEEAVLTDFYGPGDSKVIFVRAI